MGTFFTVFESYGWLGIIGLLIGMAAFIAIKWFGKKINKELNSGFERVGEKLTDQMSKQNDKLTNTIIEQQNKLINYFVNKQTTEETNHNNMLKERMNLAEDINLHIKNMLYKYNSSRVFIVEFQNTSQNLAGIPFAKYSCNYEEVSDGYKPISPICKSFPFSTISKVYLDVLNNSHNQIIYTNIKEFIQTNKTFASIFDETDTKSIIVAGIYNRHNNILIGLVFLTFNKKINDKNIDLQKFSTEIGEISSIINIQYKYDTK